MRLTHTQLGKLFKTDPFAHYALCAMRCSNITAHQKRTVWGCLTDEQKKLIKELTG